MTTPRPRARPAAVEPPDVSALRPMLPVTIAEPFDSPDHIFEVKWGGVRAIAEIESGGVRLHGRNLRDLTPLYPELSVLGRAIKAEHAVIDGEIVAWSAEQLPSFELLRSRLLQPDTPVPPQRQSPVVYHVFDLLELEGRWLLQRPLFERRNLLHERLVPQQAVQAADFVREEGTAFFQAVDGHHLEGIIAKDVRSTYQPGQRSDAWQEVRVMQADDFVVGGYTFGGGVRNDPIGSLLLGAFRRGRLEFVGDVSIGCSDREARQLLSLLAPLHADAPSFVRPPAVEARFLYWCRPELACHVRYAQWTKDRRLRFPVFVAPRPDVPPEECLAPER